MENKKHSFIKPEYLRPELSTKLYRGTFNYLKKFYSEQIFYDICAELSMPADYLRKDDNWVSIDFGRAFAEKVRQKTGDEEVYKKIGNNFLAPENINSFEYALIKSLSPFLMLKSIKQFYRKSNTVCEVEMIQHHIGHFTLKIQSKKNIYPDMAMNTYGIAEAFKDLYDLEKFETTLKMSKDSEIKEFELSVKFSAMRYYLKRCLSVLAIIFAGALFGFALYEIEHELGFKVAPALASLTFICGFAIYKLSQTIKSFKKSNEDYYTRTREKNIDLYNKAELLERRYQEANLLKQLSSELVSCKDPQEVISKCLTSIKQKFNYKKAAVFLISKEREKLYLSSSIGFEEKLLDTSKIEFAYPNPDKKEGFIATAIDKSETVLIYDLESYKQILKPANRRLLEALEVGSMIISPIQSDNNKYGAFLLLNDANEIALNNQDKFLIENITSQLSLYFESASNFQNEIKLRHIFQKYVPSTVLEQISRNLHTSDGSLKPQKKEICSVFMDLRGFTSACDNVSPEKAFELINMFAKFATEILSEEGAIIDNIIGDEIVCFFPKSSASEIQHIQQAMVSLQKISDRFADFNLTLVRSGFSKIRLGLGVHVGEASIGSVGGEAKMNFTALGKTVNVASRLQSITKKYDGETTIVASEELVKRFGEFSHLIFEEEVLRGTTHKTKFCRLTSQDIDSLLKAIGKDRIAS